MSNINRTNFVTTSNRKLIIGTNPNDTATLFDINQWNDDPQHLWKYTGAAENFKLQTRDIDFGNISRRKKIYKVYVTFRAGGYMSGVLMKYGTDGSDTLNGTFQTTTGYDNAKGFDSWQGSQAASSADWITVALQPSTSINNIYSFQLQFEFADAGRCFQIATGGTVGDNHFELDSSANGTDDYYNGMPIVVYTGSGHGVDYRVRGYASSINRVTVDRVDDGDLTDNDTIPDGYAINAGLYDVGFIPKDFAINDISIVYRDKPIK